MPLVNVRLIEGVFTPEQKRERSTLITLRICGQVRGHRLRRGGPTGG